MPDASIAARVPSSTLAELDELAGLLAAKSVGTVSRSDVVRAALVRGVRALRAEIASTGHVDVDAERAEGGP